MSSNAFYDAHCHTLTLSHPSFLAFTQTLRRRGLEEVYAQVTAPNYLIAALFFKTGERMRNMLSVMERDVGSIFELMEDDLAGKFAKDDDEAPLLADGELRLGDLRFDRLVICPLIMDFQCAAYVPSEGTYYDRPRAKPVSAQIRDVLEGIRDYRRARRGGFLEIRPFLGIDTRHYSAKELAVFLDAAFKGYGKGKAAARAAASRRAFASMVDYDEASPVHGRFAGIKVYPPLGFDPWPEGGDEREKVELLWSFCERRDIPVVTHCDDQGFRVAKIEEAWTYSSPARWEPVFRAYPDLRLDFAHFGAQYSHPIGRPAWTEWTDRIVKLMADNAKVYADFSFDGTDAEYYRWLGAYLGRMSSGLAKHVEGRLFFGSDFIVNLSKARSYTDYFRTFAKAPFIDELKARFGHENPEKFLFGD
jgi:predicted TIM-barrel fold metal-dependent hydrolase